MWVFGYGSLVWKVDFPYVKSLVGYIEGYKRRFWQGSTDHRGIPGKPGRVVTLVKSSHPQEKVWGIAYKIGEDDVENVKAHLDFREKGGYSLEKVTFHPEDTTEPSFMLQLYLATEQNANYLGPASLSDIANQILSSVGPSGKNIDYLFNLAETMRNIAPGQEDTHLYELEKEVKKLHGNEESILIS